MNQISSGSPAFDKLRDYLAMTPSARREVESALDVLVTRANPSDRGARFVFGGAVEWIVAAAAWSAGVLAAPAGHNANGFDLTDLMRDAKGLWSVKASVQKPRPRTFRLTNGMGGAGKGFVEPTVFIHDALGGIVFVDPTLHSDLASKAWEGRDAFEILFSDVSTFAHDNPANVATLTVPLNDGLSKSDPHEFIKSLLTADHYPILSSIFTAAAPVSNTTIVDVVSQLAALRSAGQITEEQFTALLSRMSPSRR